jgi:DivIVA domain-containing protein
MGMHGREALPPDEKDVSVEDQGRAWGSAELTPDAIRGVRFSLRDGGYPPAEVHEFLEQVASAMEVLQSGDLAQAMRRELTRNAEISSRIVMAGQETAERLRQQAAGDARAIIEDTKQLAEKLRDASKEEQLRTRDHVEQMRQTFIEELRDMYDRIGASLYRFESASKIDNPPAQHAPSGHEQQWQAPPESGWEAPAAQAEWEAPPEAGWDPPVAPPEPAPTLPPAWTQLEHATPAAQPQQPPQPESQDEPLVDLRDIQHEIHAEPEAVEPQEDEAQQEPDAGGSEYLALEPDELVPPDDNQRAEQLIAGMEAVVTHTPMAEPAPVQSPVYEHPSDQPVVPEPHVALEPTPPAPDLPPPPGLAPEGTAPAAPQVDLRQFVLQAITEGQSREAVEQHLAGTYGIADPAGFVDAALSGQ